MLEGRYLIRLDVSVVLHPQQISRVELVRFVCAPSEPNYPLHRSLRQSLLRDRMRYGFGFWLEYSVQLAGRYEVANASGEVPHGVEINLELVIWELEVIVDVEPLVSPSEIHLVEVPFILAQVLPLGHCPLVLLLLHSENEFLEVPYFLQNFTLLISFLLAHLSVDSELQLQLVDQLRHLMDQELSSGIEHLNDFIEAIIDLVNLLVAVKVQSLHGVGDFSQSGIAHIISSIQTRHELAEALPALMSKSWAHRFELAKLVADKAFRAKNFFVIFTNISAKLSRMLLASSLPDSALSSVQVDIVDTIYVVCVGNTTSVVPQAIED